MRFLVDAQLPPILARRLRGAGHVAEHLGDVGLLNASDTLIWRHAFSINAIVVTKDEDFANRKTIAPAGPAIVWLRVGNCSKQALLRWFAPLLPTIIDRLSKGEQLIEVI